METFDDLFDPEEVLLTQTPNGDTDDDDDDDEDDDPIIRTL